MKHLELELLRLADHVFIERNYVTVSDAKARCIEVECRILLGCDSYTYADRGLYKSVKGFELTHVVKHRNYVLPAIVSEICDILDICRLLETITYNILISVHNTLRLKSFNKIEVECGRGLKVYVVLERLLEDKLEMRTLGAIAIVICTLVIHLGHSHVEHTLCPLDLRRDLWQVSDLERSAILVDDVHHVDVVEVELAILYHELILRKLKCLVNQINVLVLHFS